MGRDVAEVLREALALPSEERAALVESLIASLDDAADDGVEQAWNEEIDHRIQQIDRGDISLIPLEAARRRLRSRLDR
jgi:putative addiction module component (TIGR02574 family)